MINVTIPLSNNKWTDISKLNYIKFPLQRYIPLVPIAAYHCNYNNNVHFLRKRSNNNYIIITSGYFIQIFYMYSPDCLHLVHFLHMQYMQMQRTTQHIIIRTAETTPPIIASSLWSVCDTGPAENDYNE